MSEFAKVVCKVEEDEVVSDFRTEKVKEESTGIQETSAFGPSNINIIKTEDGVVGDDDKDHRGRQFAVAVRAMLKNDSDKWKKEMRFEARKWMGAVLFKDLGGVRYMGRVVDYEIETGWFKVRYDDFEYEEMEKDEVIQLLANPERYRPYFHRLPASSKKRNPKRKKAPEQKKPAKRCSSCKKKPRSTTKQPSSYIPLAIRENKRDDYYWY